MVLATNLNLMPRVAASPSQLSRYRSSIIMLSDGMQSSSSSSLGITTHCFSSSYSTFQGLAFAMPESGGQLLFFFSQLDLSGICSNLITCSSYPSSESSAFFGCCLTLLLLLILLSSFTTSTLRGICLGSSLGAAQALPYLLSAMIQLQQNLSS